MLMFLMVVMEVTLKMKMKLKLKIEVGENSIQRGGAKKKRRRSGEADWWTWLTHQGRPRNYPKDDRSREIR